MRAWLSDPSITGVGYLHYREIVRGEEVHRLHRLTLPSPFWALGCSTPPVMTGRGASNSHPSRQIGHAPVIFLGLCTYVCKAVRPTYSYLGPRATALLFCTSRQHDILVAHRLRQSNIFVIPNTCTHLFLSLVSSSMTVQSEQVLTVLQRIQNSLEVVSLNSRWRNVVNPFCRFRLARSSRKTIGKTPSMY